MQELAQSGEGSDDSSPYNPNNKENVYIAAFGAIPFAGLLLTFVIVWCRRKIEDYYLKWSIITFVAFMVLRVVSSGIIIIIFMSSRL